MLWEFPFPEFEATFNHTDSNIMYASDDRLPPATLGRGRGRFPHPSSVRTPTALRYCEAVILLLCRDHGGVRETYWMAILTYVVEYIDGTDLFDEESLRDEYQQFYHALKLADPAMYSILEDIRGDLRKRRLL